MIQLSLPQLSVWLGGFLWPLFRISAFFLSAPLFGSQLVPARIRIGLSLLTTLVVAPLVPAVPAIDPLSLPAVVLIAEQVLIGIGFGFVMQMFFHIFVFGAQMIAMQMALGLASMVDPENGVNVTVVAQYFLLMLGLVFLGTNGHLVMLDVLIESFKFMPIGADWFGASGSWSIVNWASWMFLSGLLLALPAVTALLVVNMAFGVMTRAAPQLNIFSLGFPVSMVFGLFVIWASLGGFLPRFDRLSTESFAMLRQLAGVP